MSQLSDQGLSFLKEFGLLPEQFTEICRPHACPEAVVLGIIKTESGGDSGAWRYEKDYPYLHQPAVWANDFGWTEATERQAQSFSYGLMQIMLATARAQGYRFHPRMLFDPRTNISWSCFHLKTLYDKYLDWMDAVSAYNFGHPAKKLLSKTYKNQAYVDRVYGYAAGFQLSDGPKVT